jgi:hypothetical protein
MNCGAAYHFRGGPFVVIVHDGQNLSHASPHCFQILIKIRMNGVKKMKGLQIFDPYVVRLYQAIKNQMTADGKLL